MYLLTLNLAFKRLSGPTGDHCRKPRLRSHFSLFHIFSLLSCFFHFALVYISVEMLQSAQQTKTNPPAKGIHFFFSVFQNLYGLKKNNFFFFFFPVNKKKKKKKFPLLHQRPPTRLINTRHRGIKLHLMSQNRCFYHTNK